MSFSTNDPALSAKSELCQGHGCGKQQAKKCQSCLFASYCSKECQKQDWPTHKSFCRFLKTGRANPANAHSVPGIILPEDGDGCQFVWLSSSSKFPIVPAIFASDLGSKLNIEHFYSHGATHCARVLIDRNTGTGQLLGHQIIGLRKDYRSQQSNKAITKITGHHGPSTWTSIVLFYRTDDNGKSFASMTASDCMYVANYLGRYKQTHEVLYDRASAAPYYLKLIQALKVACIGDEKHVQEPKFSPVMISEEHSIYRVPDGEPPIANRVGFPLLTQRLPHDSRWPESVGGSSSYNNPSATYLHMCDDVDDDDFELAPVPDWTNWVGSVLIVRKDKKPISAEQMQSICEYFQTVLLSKFQDYKEADRQEGKEEVLDLMTAEGFKKWSESYQEASVKAGEEGWKQVDCPSE